MVLSINRVEGNGQKSFLCPLLKYALSPIQTKLEKAIMHKE